MRPAPRVGVVIVSWNCWAELERCLRSLQRCTTSATLDFTVVDNASTDGTPARLPQAFPTVRLIANRENVGFARACNQGMAASAGDLVLLLNSDTYVEDDVLGRAAHHLRDRPAVGMLGCELRFPDGRRQHTANRRLGIRRSLVERLWLYRLLPAARRAEYLLGGYWEEDREIEVDWLAGALMLLRRELFERSGGFDERFFMYGEDSEWCMRLRRMGQRILYAPALGHVYHVGAASSDLLWTEQERLERCHRGGLDSYAAVYGRSRGVAYRLAELIGSVVRWLVYGALRKLRPSVYLQTQQEFYRWLARLYVSSRRS